MKFTLLLLVLAWLLTGCAGAGSPGTGDTAQSTAVEPERTERSEAQPSEAEEPKVLQGERIDLSEIQKDARGRIALIWLKSPHDYRCIFVEDPAETEMLKGYRDSGAYRFVGENEDYDGLDSKWIIYPDGWIIGMYESVVEKNSFYPDLKNATYGGVYDVGSDVQAAFDSRTGGRRGFLPQGLCEYVDRLIGQYGM